MNPKTTRIWIVLAAALFAFIFFYQRHARKQTSGPHKPLPRLKAAAVTGVRFRWQEHAPIHAVRTNQTWQITEPIADWGYAGAIEHMLRSFEQLIAATYITPIELQGRTNVDQDFGFASEYISLLLEQEGQPLPLLKFGRRTNPGDQIFVQVAGDAGVYVVEATILELIPRAVDEWREPTLVNLTKFSFDRIGVTNNAASFALERDAIAAWRMISPNLSRADNPRILDGLLKLHSLRAKNFVPEQPKPELESFGLAPPDLEIGLSQGTTNIALLQFGKTNSAGQVYARRFGRNAIFTVPADTIAVWQRARVNDFRDRRLLALAEGIETVEVRGHQLEPFSVQRLPNGGWTCLPQNFAADHHLVAEFVAALTNMSIADFTQDAVAPPLLPSYGLAVPARQYLLYGPGFRAGASNTPLADLSFGLNQEGRVFARRADERPIYEVHTNEFARLPSAGWQLRERRLWRFSTNDIVGATIRHLGRKLQLVRSGPYQWSIAPGSSGSINDLAVEETILGLAEVEAVNWIARGEPERARFGFVKDGHQISIELKDGRHFDVEFGGAAPSGLQYAAAVLDGQLWIFEFPLPLYRQVLGYLAIPPAP